MIHLRTYLPAAALALSSVLIGCGGGLDYTVDDASVARLSAEQRAGLNEGDEAIAHAERNIATAERDVAKAEAALTRAEQAIAVKKAELRTAEAEFDYSVARHDFLEVQRVQAATALGVAHARHELAKAKAVGKHAGETEAEHQAQMARFEAQVAEAEQEDAEARLDLAERKEAMNETKQDLDGARTEM